MWYPCLLEVQESSLSTGRKSQWGIVKYWMNTWQQCCEYSSSSSQSLAWSRITSVVTKGVWKETGFPTVYILFIWNWSPCPRAFFWVDCRSLEKTPWAIVPLPHDLPCRFFLLSSETDSWTQLQVRCRKCVLAFLVVLQVTGWEVLFSCSWQDKLLDQGLRHNFTFRSVWWGPQQAVSSSSAAPLVF